MSYMNKYESCHTWISQSHTGHDSFLGVMSRYGVVTINRLLKMISLFCTRALQKRRYSAKETYNFKEPAIRSHPIVAHISRLLEIIGLFCRILSLLSGSFAKETCYFKEPTNSSHHIAAHIADSVKSGRLWNESCHTWISNFTVLSHMKKSFHRGGDSLQ